MQPAERILIGNIAFIVCCVFYLAWWLLAFRPNDPIQGMRTGWLLLPAAVAGIAGVVLIVRGVLDAGSGRQLFRDSWVVAYVVLMLVTSRVFDRPVTSELLLITGWGALTLVEINALYGLGSFTRAASLVFVLVVAACLVADLVCYVAYYRLSATAGFVDGMVPLLLAGLVMAALSVWLRTR